MLMHALAASCEELRARTGNPPLGMNDSFLWSPRNAVQFLSKRKLYILKLLFFIFMITRIAKAKLHYIMVSRTIMALLTI